MGEVQDLKLQDLQVGATGFRDLVLTPDMYEFAAGMETPTTLTGWLETEDPSDQYRNDPQLSGTDAFQRQFMAAGIVPYSNPQLGIWADKMQAFWDSKKEDSIMLLPEFIRRVWTGAQQTKALQPEQERFYASSVPISDVMYPDYISTVVRQKQIQPSVPLSLLVAITTPIDSGVYEAFRLTDSETERQYVRVPEGSEVPTAELTGSDVAIRVKKYGRRLIGTYETFRRMRIDRFALHLALLAVQTEVDKVATAIDVLVLGDGNAGTAATNSDLNGDLGGVVNDPKVLDYFKWRMLWASPYNCQIILAKAENIAMLLMMNTGSANTLFGTIGGLFGGALGTFTMANPQLQSVGIAWHADVPANKWLGIDNRFALEMVVESGSTLVETNKIVTSQFNEIVMTENVGFAIFDIYSTRTLDLST